MRRGTTRSSKEKVLTSVALLRLSSKTRRRRRLKKLLMNGATSNTNQIYVWENKRNSHETFAISVAVKCETGHNFRPVLHYAARFTFDSKPKKLLRSLLELLFASRTFHCT
jgi:hypothetical protein